MSKFQIVKGITDNLSETPYTEGKVYFTYDNAESTNLNIYADIDGTRRKIKNIHILTLQEDENEKLTTGEDDSVSNYIRNNELVIIYYMNMPFYLVSFDRGFDFATTDGHYKLRYSNNNHSWIYTDREASFAYQDEIPENISDLNNDSGFQTSTEVNSAIATAIGNINQFNVAIVSTLPTENIDDHTIYFMSNGGSDDSIYDEWMYINNNWEKIGTTAVDLSGYMQTSHPANGITSTDISNWNKKSNLWAVGSKRSADDYYWTLAISQNSLWNLNNAPGSNGGIGYITLPVNRNGSVYENVQLQLPITNGTVALTSDIPTVPTNISSFTNDSGYLTSYTETDPTVPAWAKAANKPTYTAAEVGALPDTTVIPDISGKVSKSGDTMTGRLTLNYNNNSGSGLRIYGLNETYTDIQDTGYAGDTTNYTPILQFRSGKPNSSSGTTISRVYLQGIATPTSNDQAANKEYVDNKIPKVYSSTNTTGYLTMDTLPIYDGTVV